jgi:hypothetical protein
MLLMAEDWAQSWSSGAVSERRFDLHVASGKEANFGSKQIDAAGPIAALTIEGLALVLNFDVIEDTAIGRQGASNAELTIIARYMGSPGAVLSMLWNRALW